LVTEYNVMDTHHLKFTLAHDNVECQAASPHEVNPFAKGSLAYFLQFCSTLGGEPKGEAENVAG